jgi:DNA topoisomerase-3
MKNLYIAEKPSVAKEFAKALGITAAGRNGYIEQGDSIVTWCVGHLITMSYPDAYDGSLKRWSMDTIPFIPAEYKYEVIPASAKQFDIVKGLLNRDDVACIYVCTDSGREGEYIYRLVDAMAKVDPKKEKRRVWIDSQTEEEILRGIKEAKPLSAYDNLSTAAYLRAKEDYLMGINFSRALTLKYSNPVRQYLGTDKCVIAVGRVMTCVLGMIVRREREIREFVPTPFYRVVAQVGNSGDSGTAGENSGAETLLEAEWRAVEGSKYFEHPALYKENGFKKEEDAKALIAFLQEPEPVMLRVDKVEKKTEKKNPPMLYNLAELQNDCSKFFKISPSETLAIVQELYEKKLVTYPRTDARVLSTAVAKEIGKNISGLRNYGKLGAFADNIMKQGGYRNIAKSKYVNDKQITDHYAIIPTGQGLGALNSVGELKGKVYELIARRFLSIFYPAAEYLKAGLVLERQGERFFASFRRLMKPGYLEIADVNFGKRSSADKDGEENEKCSEALMRFVTSLKKGNELSCLGFDIREGETSPPKRYSSGTLILAMENAGQLIEDEDLRAQIKGSGIGTSATRDSIITKLVNNKYIALNKKTQIVTPTFLGEIIYDVVLYSVNGLLRADLTASWEKGLEGVAEGTISEKEYSDKMNDYVVKYTNFVKGITNQNNMRYIFDKSAPYYKQGKK